MQNLIQSVLDLFYPPRCLFCQGTPGGNTANALQPLKLVFEGLERVLCEDCARQIPWAVSSCPFCAYPGDPGQEAGPCAWCWDEHLAFDFCCALGSYSKEIRQSLYRLKYRGEKALAAPFGDLLAARLSAVPWIGEVDLMVPVPLCRRRLKERGYNQSSLLAARVSKNLALPLEQRLIRVKETQSQTALNKKQRKANLAGAFSCPRPLPSGCHVLLVDDVLTTGATAHQAASALKDAGAGRVSVAVLAR